MIQRHLMTALFLTLSGCSSAPASDPQTPPTTGKADVEAWLGKGFYKSWHCEGAPHAARSPSPHGSNRICSNNLTSVAGAGEYPIGAASVKELLDQSNAITGYAVYLKTAKGGGESFYWYERTGADVVGDGLGTSGPPKTVCVGCHTGAGSDANHSGHDFVYTQVK